MADVELLPLPDWMECLGEVSAADIRDYARANVAHATAAQAAEIEALRAEVERLQDSVNRLGLEGGQFMSRTAAAEARAERLAEALRLAEEHINAITPEWYSAGQRVLAEIRAALAKENKA